jgi:hypothetical protein
LLTHTIAAHRRQSPHQPDVDLAVEYPPHDGSLDGAGLPAPPGASGGGFGSSPDSRRIESGLPKLSS